MCVLQYWRDLGFTEVTITKDDTLAVANTQPACISGPAGEHLFFNFAGLAVFTPKQAGPWPFEVTYGDGQRIEDDIIQDIHAAQWRASCVALTDPFTSALQSIVCDLEKATHVNAEAWLIHSCPLAFLPFI